MKICITAKDKEGNLVDPRFGRASKFAIYNEDGEKIKTVDNSAVKMSRGAGVKAAEKIIDEGVQVLITGNIGPHAMRTIKNMDLEIYLTEAGISTKDAFEKWQKGLLSKANK